MQKTQRAKKKKKSNISKDIVEKLNYFNFTKKETLQLLNIYTRIIISRVIPFKR